MIATAAGSKSLANANVSPPNNIGATRVRVSSGRWKKTKIKYKELKPTVAD